MNQLHATKMTTKQHWTASGKRIPVTSLALAGNVVIQKSEDSALMGFGTRKASRTSKPMSVMLKKHNIAFGVRTIRKMTGATERNEGDMMVPSDVFTVGDIVKVTGVSKGLGFAGVVKRHGFAGGPKTHGQSDRHRAPGSIGNRTTPGRVFRNKRMAGRGGSKTVTVENLQVVGINNESGEIMVKGVVPGAIFGTVKISKVRDGKFEGLFVKAESIDEKKIVEEKPVEAKEEVVVEKVEEVKSEPKEAKKPEQKAEKTEEKPEAKKEEVKA
jgi:large subunit ribosomal protein L3